MPVEDPLIDLKPGADYWKLRHPKVPYSESGSDLEITVYPTDIVPGGENILPQIEEITRQTFLLLEDAWAQLECHLIDFKIEFGITTDGYLVVADVIDNDSWRLRTKNWEELSKQLFRDNVNMEEVSSKYQLVAELSDNFWDFLTEASIYCDEQYEMEDRL